MNWCSARSERLQEVDVLAVNLDAMDEMLNDLVAEFPAQLRVA